jgi:hypothetical protein
MSGVNNGKIHTKDGALNYSAKWLKVSLILIPIVVHTRKKQQMHPPDIRIYVKVYSWLYLKSKK